MKVNQKLLESSTAAAARIRVDQVTIGLGYTAVATSDGAMGLAATGWALDGGGESKHDVADFEGCPATDLLQLIMNSDPMHRTMALALINALNHRQALALPEDPGNALLFNHFGILSGNRVAMVGYFPPLVRLLEEKKVPLWVIDDARGLDDKETFFRKLEGWADVLLITATSILNNSTESILAHAGPNVKTILLGPTTPMIPEAFDHLPIHMLAGSAITDGEGAMRIVRHGGGARSLKPFIRKVYRLTAKENPR